MSGISYEKDNCTCAPRVQQPPVCEYCKAWQQLQTNRVLHDIIEDSMQQVNNERLIVALEQMTGMLRKILLTRQLPTADVRHVVEIAEQIIRDAKGVKP